MAPNLTPQNVLLLLGTALVICGVMVLVVYALHKSLRRERKKMSLNAPAPRAKDENAFLVASMQGVITKMKTREKELEKLLRDAEWRAELSTRTLEVLAYETAQILMVFDQEGFLTLANPAARTVLEVDTWSRRRYLEIFNPDSPIALAIGTCLKSGKGGRQSQLTYTSPSGRKDLFRLTLAPYHGRGGKLGGVVCLLAAQPAQPPR